MTRLAGPASGSSGLRPRTGRGFPRFFSPGARRPGPATRERRNAARSDQHPSTDEALVRRVRAVHEGAAPRGRVTELDVVPRAYLASAWASTGSWRTVGGRASTRRSTSVRRRRSRERGSAGGDTPENPARLGTCVPEPRGGVARPLRSAPRTRPAWSRASRRPLTRGDADPGRLSGGKSALHQALRAPAPRFHVLPFQSAGNTKASGEEPSGWPGQGPGQPGAADLSDDAWPNFRSLLDESGLEAVEPPIWGFGWHYTNAVTGRGTRRAGRRSPSRPRSAAW